MPFAHMDRFGIHQIAFDFEMLVLQQKPDFGRYYAGIWNAHDIVFMVFFFSFFFYKLKQVRYLERERKKREKYGCDENGSIQTYHFDKS